MGKFLRDGCVQHGCTWGGGGGSGGMLPGNF